VVNWLETQTRGSWQDRRLASGEATPDWRGLVRNWRDDRLGARAGGLTHIGAGLLPPPKRKPRQSRCLRVTAKKFAEAFLKGQPLPSTIATTVFKDKIDQLRS